MRDQQTARHRGVGGIVTVRTVGRVGVGPGCAAAGQRDGSEDVRRLVEAEPGAHDERVIGQVGRGQAVRVLRLGVGDAGAAGEGVEDHGLGREVALAGGVLQFEGHGATVRTGDEIERQGAVAGVGPSDPSGAAVECLDLAVVRQHDPGAGRDELADASGRRSRPRLVGNGGGDGRGGNRRCGCPETNHPGVVVLATRVSTTATAAGSQPSASARVVGPGEATGTGESQGGHPDTHGQPAAQEEQRRAALRSCARFRGCGPPDQPPRPPRSSSPQRPAR